MHDLAHLRFVASDQDRARNPTMAKQSVCRCIRSELRFNCRESIGLGCRSRYRGAVPLQAGPLPLRGGVAILIANLHRASVPLGPEVRSALDPDVAGPQDIRSRPLLSAHITDAETTLASRVPCRQRDHRRGNASVYAEILQVVGQPEPIQHVQFGIVAAGGYLGRGGLACVVGIGD